MMKKLLPILLVLAVPFAAAAEPKGKKIKAKVAIVDVDRCVGETEDGLRAKAALGKYKLRVDSELYAMESELKAMETDLQGLIQDQQKAGKTTPDPKMQALAVKYQNALQEYQTHSKKMQANLANYEDQLFLPIEKKIKGIFSRIADAEGFDLIVERRALPIALKPELDLTERVIREYNQGPPAATTASASGSASAPPKKP